MVGRNSIGGSTRANELQVPAPQVDVTQQTILSVCLSTLCLFFPFGPVNVIPTGITASTSHFLQNVTECNRHDTHVIMVDVYIILSTYRKHLCSPFPNSKPPNPPGF